MTALYRGVDLNGQALEVEVNAGVISSVSPIGKTPGLPWILPPLVDIQHNGALTHAYNNTVDENVPELQRIAHHLKKNCVGRVLATFTTTDYPRLERAAGALGRIFDQDKDLGTLFCGIFHEGCFISPDKGWRGGHAPEFIIKPDYERFSRLNEASGNRVKVDLNLFPKLLPTVSKSRSAIATRMRKQSIRRSMRELRSSPTSPMVQLRRSTVSTILSGDFWTMTVCRSDWSVTASI